MTVTDEFVAANKSYQEGFNGPLPLPPARKIAVIACMDARLDPARILGIAEGDAHVIRNAGGVVTEDALRSLAISQRLLGTEEIVLVHHTDCGMITFKGRRVPPGDRGRDRDPADLVLRSLPRGPQPTWRQGINRIKANPFIPKTDQGARLHLRRGDRGPSMRWVSRPDPGGSASEKVLPSAH